MKKAMLAIMLLSLLLPAYSQNSKLVAVMIDERTQTAIGKYPIDRKYYADIINKLSEYKAKAIILKFFFDLPKDKMSDELFAGAMGNADVILQATIQKNTESNDLDSRFSITVPNINESSLIRGNEGWIPIRTFQDHANDIGFVDLKAGMTNRLPLIENYKGSNVKSLTLIVLQKVFPNLKIVWGNEISNGNKAVKLNKENKVEIPAIRSDSIKYVSFIDVLNGTFDTSLFENNIIYVAYDGDSQGFIQQNSIKIKAHRYYFYCLEYLIAKLNN